MQALLCVPLLDAAILTRFLTRLSRTREQISAAGLALLFSAAGATVGPHEQLEQTTAAFIDACRQAQESNNDTPYWDVPTRSPSISSPRDMSQLATPEVSLERHNEQLQRAQDWHERILAQSLSGYVVLVVPRFAWRRSVV